MIPKVVSRWWFIAIAALLHGFLTPPWNHERHILLFIAPFVSTLLLIPFFHVAYSNQKRWVKVLKYWLYGVFSVGAGSYWILDVEVEGMPLLMFQALAALALFFGAWFIPVGLSLSLLKKYRPSFLWVTFPICWVLFDYVRTWGELSFPWHFEGYSYVHFLPFAQLASITGIWGMSFLIVLMVFTLYLLLAEGKKWRRYLIIECVVAFLVVLGGAVTLFRTSSDTEKTSRFALVQSNMDQENWNGYISLDSALTKSDSMIGSVSDQDIDYAVLPESGIFCYLMRTGYAKRSVQKWAKKYNTSVITGTLHKEVGDTETFVYNSCFYLPKDSKDFTHYYKQKLVPFGESLPFKGLFPLINRLDLGGGDFSRGVGNTIWSLGDSISVSPSICYEAIYPSYMHRRAVGAEMFLNVTNDGWFGDGSGPYQHRTIARTRVIENGVPLVRVANSGISYVADQYGRYIAQSSLGTREVLVVDVPLANRKTVYRRWGDWFLILSFLLLLVSFFLKSPASIDGKPQVIT